MELEPVRADQAETYLRLSTRGHDRLDRWEPVFAELRRVPTSPVAAVISTARRSRVLAAQSHPA